MPYLYNVLHKTRMCSAFQIEDSAFDLVMSKIFFASLYKPRQMSILCSEDADRPLIVHSGLMMKGAKLSSGKQNVK